jgi:hypothetical protein
VGEGDYMNEKRAGLGKPEEIWGMLRQCEAPGCKAITLGGTCVLHDPEELTDRQHPYGRPFARPVVAAAEISTATISTATA